MDKNVEFLGSLYGLGTGYAGAVYDKNGVSPALTTMQGGGREPHIAEVKQLGYIENGTGKHQSNTVYSTDGICPNITTINGGGTQQIKVAEVKELDKQIVAIDEQNMSVRTETVGCLTTDGSSPKHNNRAGEIITLGNYMPSEHDASRVVDTNGIAPTVRENHGTVTGIVETRKIKIKQATKQGFIEMELPGVCDLNYPSSNTRRGRVVEGGRVSPTLTTENIPSVIEIDDRYNGFIYDIDGRYYLIRIRKLTPRECWRLMDFRDEDFDKASEVNSSTQLYKQAGNSIVKNVLVAVIGQMIEGRENVYKERVKKGGVE